MQNHYLPAISPVMRQLWSTLAVMALVVAFGLGLEQAGAPIRLSQLQAEVNSVEGEVTQPDEAVQLSKNSASKATVGGLAHAVPDVEPKAVKPHLVRAVMERFSVNAPLAQTIVYHAYHEAKSSELPVTLLLAVMARESSFRPKAINQQDWGLMQVNLKWHAKAIEKVGGPKALLRPAPNIKVGTQILKQYVVSAGSIRGGLRRYNGLGKDNAYPDEVVTFMREFQAAARIS